MTRTLRALGVAVAVLVGLAALAAAATGLWIADLVRDARRAAALQLAARRQAAADDVRALADRDVLGRCTWCGHTHDDHPARVHADEISPLVQARMAAA